MRATKLPQDAKPLWRDMDAATRASAYSPSSVLPRGDLMPFIRRYIDLSVQVYQSYNVQTVTYGPKPANTIDLILPATHPAPLHVFIHGGYWQELSKRESMFPAPDTLARGIGFAAVDYTLAPHASLDEIVAECTAAITHLFENAEALGIDRTRIVISGSSAGAHLAAMTCQTLPTHMRPKGAVLISGVYELEPLIGTYINDPLHLDVAAAHRNSPALHSVAHFPRTVITWGEQETDEFKRQSRQFAQLLQDADTQVTAFEVPNRNHFDIVEDLAGDTPLGNALADLLS